MSKKYVEKYLEGAEFGYLATVEEGIRNGVGIDVRYENGSTALILASREDYTSIVSYLIEHGADVNGKNNLGDTALIKDATYTYNTEVSSILLNAGADTKVIGCDGTALDNAVQRGRLELALLLLNADPTISTEELLELRESTTNKDMLSLLDSYGNRVGMKEQERDCSVIDPIGFM